MRPLVCILDASIGVTGALVAARREAELIADRARVFLVVPRAFKAPASELAAFERVVHLPIRPLRRSIGSLIAYIPALFRSGRLLRDLLRESGCDRLQVNDFTLAEGWMARRLGYRGRIVTWVRIDPKRFGLAGRLWLKAAQSASDAMVAVSKFIRDRSPKLNIELVYDPALHAARVEPTGQRLLFVGNYTRGKGQDVAIRAFHALANDFPNATLALHGATFGLPKNDAYRRELVEIASGGPGCKRIELDSYADDLPALYAGTLAAVNCSESESFSLTCQDASAHGLPVIATQCGGPEEIIDHGTSGLLVPVGDVAAVEGAMRRLLSDPEEARRMGEAGYHLVRRRFGTNAYVAKVTQLLELIG
ncbi:glycosyltransferase family 4 protein [Sphingomonas sp. HDW15A]|uniref:glycosyltransferase family 4 protein n=1 Tax=Sphingomonas sp. HDW15A TaxID=2714942 RepID=UPI00140DDDA5|nr:glycosyltransferase family 4 protein [Sphingomonas sp. HDW15A]QIK95832.1 glycosyltransferase family 4 protein [Sphingomonas sp. HDW15A]